MRLLISTGVALLSLVVVTSAQDTDVKSRSRIKADDAQVVAMTGCLRKDASTGGYTLVGTVAAAGDDVTTKSRVRTDVDDDETTVKSRTTTKVDGGEAGVGAALSTFTLVPRQGVDLASHVGRQVQVSAIVVERGHGDADVKIEDKTRVEAENGRDRTSRSRTEVELPRTPIGQYAVVSVKSLGGSCSAR